MSDRGWNGDPDPFTRLADALRGDHEAAAQWVETVEEEPGGALDALRVELREYTGTVPETVVSEIYAHGLGIRTVGGYKSVTVSRPERVGGDLSESEEESA